ncbi:hypothetical protein DFH07DRAFT_946256 [Mycena maculata]|uniref:Uncharacterized protein n=1 Tax=Mycena maculata TaxID=230809 RepID=A0AAD7MNM9_9AGAR|nr:hypothetical protein DFH07DRAFT_946256 [Mycena maculata]
MAGPLGGNRSTFFAGPAHAPPVNSDAATMACPLCKKDIKVGTGGAANLEIHKGRSQCLKSQEENKKKDKKPMKNAKLAGFGFVKKIARAISPKVSDPPPVRPVSREPTELESEPESSRTSPIHGPLESSRGSSLQPSARSTSPLTLLPFIYPFSEHSGFHSEGGFSEADIPIFEVEDSPCPNPVVQNTVVLDSRPCPGIQIEFPAGQNAHLSYPFGVHAKYRLPWSYRSEGDRFFLRSTVCKNQARLSAACKKCEALRKNDFLIGILDRISNGVKAGSTNIWFPIGGLLEKVGHQFDQLDALRATKLNDARKLVQKMAELDLHKQLMMAIASGDVQRVAPLLQAGINHGESVGAILERFYRACVDVYREGPLYNPKGFTKDEYMVMICVLRLGGARLADILHRALGLPGLTTVRKHAVIRPLRASPGLPTVEEIVENIDAYTDGEDVPVGPAQIIHRVVMLDEIAVERRARWDDKTNMILGACREHCKATSLEFAAMEDATRFFEDLRNDDVHLASEATVVAFGALAKDPQMYNPRPICISGTCKHETGSQHADFLRIVNSAAEQRRTHGNITYRTISFASDGEAKRGAAFVKEFMKFQLQDSSPIYPLLSPLVFMNFQVGPDDITPDKDFRHVIKTLRNLLMRRTGSKVLGQHIKPAFIKQHLRAVGLTKERIDILLNPNDKQDVPLGYQLLKELWSLPDALPLDNPGFCSTRRALQTLGKLGYYLVMPYICITLSLRDQLTYLSTAAHLLLILFTSNRAGTECMANQTFINIMLMIKNGFFCVAKAKIDIPDSEFFLILLGTNREEKLFGLIRTAVGPDSNVDIYQLAGRASNLTEVSKILSLRPEWDRGPRRLHLPAIINESGDVSQKADQVSPASWVGNVRVSTAVPQGCWKAGRTNAERLIPTGADALLRCAQIPGFDILAPFGKSLVGVPDAVEAFHPDPVPDAIDAFHPDPELGRPVASDENTAETEQLSNEPDIEDIIAIADSTRNKKHSPHIFVDGKKVSKATILSNLMQGRSSRLSTDRTRRVAGIGAFNNSSPTDMITFNGPLGTPSLRIGNPVATMVNCEGNLFLAIAQVNGIVFGSQETESISLDLLPDRGTKVSFQILRLVAASVEDDPSTVHDWRWSLAFESTFNGVPGALIHPLNPTVSNRNPGKPTYLFSSPVLITVGATVFSQTPGLAKGIPQCKRTDRFPYRHNGKACFLIDDGEWTRGEFKSSGEAQECPKCDPPVPLKSKNNQRTLCHNGAHILFDPSIQRSDQPCGLCMRPFPMCSFELTKTEASSAVRQVDWRRSKCLNPLTFQMSAAKTSTTNSPCTNHMIICPLQCEQCIWTYNLDAHCLGPPHNLASLHSVPRVYQMAPGEEAAMQKIWDERQMYPKPRNLKNQKGTKPLLISAAHSATNALHLGETNLRASSVDSEERPGVDDDVPTDLESDNGADSDSYQGDASNDENGAAEMDSRSDISELEYFDEPTVEHPGLAPLQPLFDDDVDQEIQRCVAPGMDYKSGNVDHTGPYSVQTDDPPSESLALRKFMDYNSSAMSPSAVQTQLPPAAITASTSTITPAAAINATTTNAGPLKRTRNVTTTERKKVCDCGLKLTEEEKADPGVSIKCIKLGCESIWSAWGWKSALRDGYVGRVGVKRGVRRRIVEV